MKNSLLIRFLIICILLICQMSQAQIQYCSYESKNYKNNCIESLLKSTSSVDDFKTVRVNIHFILTSSGTGNFTETKNLYGTTSVQNGYWYADKVIELCNGQLVNEEMTQQLSYESIPVNSINLAYKLNGVFFDRNDYYFNNTDTHTGLAENSDEALNVLLYPHNQGSGAAGYEVCWVGGLDSAYHNYLLHGNWGIERFTCRPSDHEIGHLLSLDHAKRYNYNGNCCTNDSPTCLDDCDDTPTYLDLLYDGYVNPCIWNGAGYSNNIMDFSPNQRAFTPCQIEKVHSYIENHFYAYQYGYFSNSSVNITSFSGNKAYIAETVTIPSGYSITIPNNQRLYIDAEELVINGQFEVPLGSTFEFIPYGL